MPKFYIYAIVILWVAALAMLVVGLIAPKRLKIAFIASIVGIVPGLGAGLAIAGVWIGLLMMRPIYSDAGIINTVKVHWADIVLILCAAPPLAMFGVATMFLIASKGIEDE